LHAAEWAGDETGKVQHFDAFKGGGLKQLIFPMCREARSLDIECLP
jgi:hypothetical protein